MHLKSLVLKGFKSFADRSVMKFEPGITSIVGPNGSGKSNISDAVLWVLGERNAKNLRGQVMEDVIFAGSSARKSLGIAEVDLILDNSDGTLPIDFDEVSLTRRMYRSGESEYLINGAPARRMDFLDILHDTGLGAGTHSVIGQGNLDAVLSGRPQDRCALIEEAAGVLKHKQRKSRSERKLEALDTHLVHVKDVAAEMHRQLKPLERKAKRAQAYREASSELSQLELVLAVDDLRSLQRAWNAVLEREKAALDAVDGFRALVEKTEIEVQESRRLLQEHDSDRAKALLGKAKLEAAVGRFDSLNLLLHEKSRRIDAGLEDALSTLRHSTPRVARLTEELSTLRGRLDSKQASAAELEEEREQAALEARRIAEELAALEANMEKLRQNKQNRDEEARQAENALEKLRRKMKSCDEAKADAELDRRAAQNDFDRIGETLAAAKESHRKEAIEVDALRNAASRANEEKDRLESSFKDASRLLEAARADAQVLRARIEVLEEHIRTSLDRNDMAAWIVRNAGESALPLAACIQAPQELEGLVELLASEALASPCLSSSAAEELARRACASREKGVGVILCERSESDFPASNERRLVDALHFPKELEGAIEHLFGDVVLADSLDEALEQGLDRYSKNRYAMADGSVVAGRGRIVLRCEETESSGLLAKERERSVLLESLADAEKNIEKLGKKKADAFDALNDMRLKTEEIARSRARHEGALANLVDEVARLERRIEACNETKRLCEHRLMECERETKKLELEASNRNDRLRRLSEERAKDEERIEIAKEGCDRAKDRERSLQLRHAEISARHRLVEEQIRSMDREASEREHALRKAEHANRKAELDSRKLAVAKERLGKLCDTVDVLLRDARARAEAMEDALARKQGLAAAHAKQEADACKNADKARESLEAARAEAGKAQVEKGKLEAQVEHAVSVITDACGVPLESALEAPEPHDRKALEARISQLRGLLDSIGSIDSSAAEEYEAARERYDFVTSQIEDVEAARRALQRIVDAIDARIKERFDQTFEEVDESFRRIFGQLFPGGSGWLELTSTEEGDRLGLEVHAQPRGKKITKMTLMSGGERSLTAIALLFAVYGTRRTPFYILDEVEAALDDSNLRRLLSYLDSQRHDTQLIMVTHQRRTMELSDVLYGVSMQADGVTKVISQKLERHAPHAS